MFGFTNLKTKFYKIAIKINKRKNLFNLTSNYSNFDKNYLVRLQFHIFTPTRYSKFGKIIRNKKTKSISYYYICFFLSVLGIFETFYLTFSKLNASTILCSNQTCSIVLNSVFSYFLDIPLSSFGFVLYFSVGVQFLKALIKLPIHNIKPKNSQVIIYILSLFLGFFSFYFTYILENILKTSCHWCVFSIFLSGFTLTVTTIIGAGDKNLKIKSFLGLSSLTFFIILIVNALNIIELQNF